MEIKFRSVIVICFFLMGIIQMTVSPVLGEEWYDGGTLHKKNIKEWKNAVIKNKLATCADFIVTLTPKQKKGLLFENNAKILKERAGSLVICISTAVLDIKEVDHLAISEIAVVCALMLGFNK